MHRCQCDLGRREDKLSIRNARFPDERHPLLVQARERVWRRLWALCVTRESI